MSRPRYTELATRPSVGNIVLVSGSRIVLYTYLPNLTHYFFSFFYFFAMGGVRWGHTPPHTEPTWQTVFKRRNFFLTLYEPTFETDGSFELLPPDPPSTPLAHPTTLPILFDPLALSNLLFPITFLYGGEIAAAEENLFHEFPKRVTRVLGGTYVFFRLLETHTQLLFTYTTGKCKFASAREKKINSHLRVLSIKNIIAPERRVELSVLERWVSR